MEENKDLELTQNKDNAIRFDFSKLYQGKVDQNQSPRPQEPTPFITPASEQNPVVFQNNNIEQKTVMADARPAFDINTIEPEKNKDLEFAQNIDNDITQDYNSLYQNQVQQNSTPQPQEPTPFIAPVIEQTPIVFEDNKQEQQEIVSEIIPTFDTNALEEDLPEELRPKVEEPLIHSMTTEAQKEKKEERQNLLFIIIFFAVLIVAVLVVFPLLAGV